MVSAEGLLWIAAVVGAFKPGEVDAFAGPEPVFVKQAVEFVEVEVEHK